MRRRVVVGIAVDGIMEGGGEEVAEARIKGSVGDAGRRGRSSISADISCNTCDTLMLGYAGWLIIILELSSIFAVIYVYLGAQQI
jgi:hypothetical protein